jgi:hypothetical protein
MADISSNDNSSLPRPAADQPDAHGQAAMLLVESLIHGLIARSLISVADAVEIVDVAVNVSHEMAAEQGDRASIGLRAAKLLQAISRSLSMDLPRS